LESQGNAHSSDELDAVMRLRSSLVASPVARGSECPGDSEWPLVAAGLKEREQTEALLRHAAGCDHCGPLLRQSVQDFSDDLTAEEETMLARLESSQAGWQERMAGELGENPRRRGLGAWLRAQLLPARDIRRWAYAGGLALLAAVGYRGLLLVQQPAINDLLATAYTEQRTLDLRIPGAAHGPVRLVRGSADRSRLDRPPALLEGEARIARELAKAPASPTWLQAMGRADVLDWNYEAAIGSLQRALGIQPDSPSLMIDLASAYFERGEANTRMTDYAAAVELLNGVLKTSPDDPVALFNRAVVYERMHLYDQAIQDWQRYLRVDPGSAWTVEAKKRLADVEQSKKRTQ
jgi:tetratricopeptide (TPR) repeat protein